MINLNQELQEILRSIIREELNPINKRLATLEKMASKFVTWDDLQAKLATLDDVQAKLSALDDVQAKLATLEELKMIVYSLRDAQEETKAQLDGMNINLAKVQGALEKLTEEVQEIKLSLQYLKDETSLHREKIYKVEKRLERIL